LEYSLLASLLVLRISPSVFTGGFHRIFQMPAIQAIPLVEIMLLNCVSEEDIRK